jgi:hypothetical protein
VDEMTGNKELDKWRYSSRPGWGMEHWADNQPSEKAHVQDSSAMLAWTKEHV